MLFRKRKLMIKALPGDLPDFFSVDISKLKIGGTIAVSSLLDEKYTFLQPESTAIVQVKTSRTAVGGDEEEEDEEGAEGADGADGAEATAEAAAE
jgi:large subunit ribosomal protein L25